MEILTDYTDFQKISYGIQIFNLYISSNYKSQNIYCYINDLKLSDLVASFVKIKKGRKVFILN